MTFSSPTRKFSPAASRKVLATPSSSSSIKSARSAKPSKPSKWRAKPITPPSYPIAAAKPKTPSSPISSSLWAPAKSKPAPPHRGRPRLDSPLPRPQSAAPVTERDMTSQNKRPKPIVLTVLDGWGYRAETKGNAIALARKPNYDRLLQEFPNTLIHTSGPAVGLPEGQMGNSEVGHLNIGAGRIVHMDITRIDQLIASGEFQHQPLLREAMERGRARQLHLLGLLSDGGVHSHIEHLYALLRMARENKVTRVFVHCFMDGRDTPPNSGIDFLRALEQKMREYGAGQIATVIGRYYAMDRDNRWDRIEKSYRAMAHGEADARFPDPVAVMRVSYEK